MKTFYLRELAHARAGDKGDTNNIGVIAYEPHYYPIILRTALVETLDGRAQGIHLEVGADIEVRRLALALHHAPGDGRPHRAERDGIAALGHGADRSSCRRRGSR